MVPGTVRQLAAAPERRGRCIEGVDRGVVGADARGVPGEVVIDRVIPGGDTDQRLPEHIRVAPVGEIGAESQVGNQLTIEPSHDFMGLWRDEVRIDLVERQHGRRICRIEAPVPNEHASRLERRPAAPTDRSRELARVEFAVSIRIGRVEDGVRVRCGRDERTPLEVPGADLRHEERVATPHDGLSFLVHGVREPEPGLRETLLDGTGDSGRRDGRKEAR